jgi:hypothetical protein
MTTPDPNDRLIEAALIAFAVILLAVAFFA